MGGRGFISFFFPEDNPNSRHYNMVVDETEKKNKKNKTEIWKKRTKKKPKKTNFPTP